MIKSPLIPYALFFRVTFKADVLFKARKALGLIWFINSSSLTANNSMPMFLYLKTQFQHL